MSNSVKPQFGFGTKAQDKEENTIQEEKAMNSPVEGIESEVEDTDLDNEYTDRRSVTIALVKNYSLYRRANDKAIANRRDYIGSSINSSTVLSSNKVEVETYFPALLGEAPNSPTFITRVKQYLNNIQIPVDEIGKTFDTTFIYNTKRDYLKVLKKEEAIEDKYNAVPKNNLKLLKEALKYFPRA